MAKDKYSNLAHAVATETIAGTIAFTEIKSGVAIFEKVAWLISRIEYWMGPPYLNLMLDEDDYIEGGLVSQNTMANMLIANSAVIDLFRVTVKSFGVAASAYLFTQPWVKDFSSLPMGGILIPPTPLFLAVQGYSLAAVCGIAVRIFFTYVELKPEDYWELVESRNIIS